MITPSPRDWPEDFSHENGNYYNTCLDCEHRFIGHKRRMQCKLCANLPVRVDAPSIKSLMDGARKIVEAAIASRDLAPPSDLLAGQPLLHTHAQKITKTVEVKPTSMVDLANSLLHGPVLKTTPAPKAPQLSEPMWPWGPWDYDDDDDYVPMDG